MYNIEFVGETILNVLDDSLMTEKGRLWKKLLTKLPKKYWKRVWDFSEESDLVDGCRYMLTFAEPYRFCGDESVPVRNVAEAVQFIKEAYER